MLLLNTVSAYRLHKVWRVTANADTVTHIRG
jgi:hypothetical protein